MMQNKNGKVGYQFDIWAQVYWFLYMKVPIGYHFSNILTI